jgi:hypothetical protein
MALNEKHDFHMKNFYTNIMKTNALLYKYQFLVEFIGLEALGIDITDSSDASKNITYYVQSAEIPGYSMQNGKSIFMGTEFRIPGVRKYDHTWAPQILLDENMFAYKGLQQWREKISSLKIDGGGQKVIPNVQARLSLLSPDHQTKVASFILEGVWIKSLGEISLAYSANGGGDLLKVPATFKYQYVYPDDTFDQAGDPLKAVPATT